jgi:hypothetical protein
VLVCASQHGNPEVDRGEAGSAGRVAVERTAIEIGPLDEQIWKGASAPKCVKLRPKATVSECDVEVENPLALDDSICANQVVAHLERQNFNE